MSRFVKYTREDGTVEWRNVNYDALMAAGEEAKKNPDTPIDLTPEQIALDTLNALRHQRDAKIAETDWWVLPDRTPTQAQLDYRQALRDITNTYTSINDVVWPTKPS
tara:strand:+ start:2680 stop:3000 length:321 start_codon:yes stop_codon:yes gene_type:complete